MQRPSLVIVTPALADANNGNWQTAQRWGRLLRGHYRVRLAAAWQPGAAGAHAGPDDIMVALHARRSAAAVQAWHEHANGRPLVLVLTGTDLYRDIDSDAAAQRSLQCAHRLVVLNELGLQRLPPALRSKGVVCLQSTTARQPLTKTGRHLRALMVGHLRAEKSPQTYFAAARLLAGRNDIWLDHIGGALDDGLADEARKLMLQCPRYRWLGAHPHEATRRRIQAAHVLVHCSRMEGGAHVVTEAITSGTPVLVSRIDGHLGLLGAGYSGVFDWGDATELATLLQRCRDDAAMLPALAAQCQARSALFSPAREQQVLLDLLAGLLPAPLSTHPRTP